MTSLSFAQEDIASHNHPVVMVILLAFGVCTSSAFALFHSTLFITWMSGYQRVRSRKGQPQSSFPPCKVLPLLRNLSSFCPWRPPNACLLMRSVRLFALAVVNSLNYFQRFFPFSLRGLLLPPDGNKRWICLKRLTAEDTCIKAQQLQ